MSDVNKVNKSNEMDPSEMSEIELLLSESECLEFNELLEFRTRLDEVIAERAKEERDTLNQRVKELQEFFGVHSTSELFKTGE